MTCRFLSILALVMLSGACSAAVSPDIRRLGDGGTSHGGDGGPGMDGGPGHDGGPGVDLGPGHDAGPGVDGGPPPVDGGPMCPTDCADTISCTADGCNAATGMCTHVPMDSLCGTGMRCSASGCVPLGCSSDASCSDGDPCNGVERCAAGSCVGGPAPSCDDGHDCTADSCVTGTGCVHAPNDALCDDGVDCTGDTCSATGCNHAPNDALCNDACFMGATCDTGGGCFGGGPVTCMPDGNPCTSDPTTCDPSATPGCSHPLHDNDGDGHGNAFASGTDCRPLGGDDCNDMNATIFPGATEICNGVDDNCNAMIDEGGVCGPTGPDSCATEQAILLSHVSGATIGGSASGSNPGDADNYTASCGRSGGRDAVYYVDIPAGTLASAVDVVITTDVPGTDFDTLLAEHIGNTCGAWDLCNDDIMPGVNTHSTITLCIPAGAGTTGTRMHILVDGYDGTTTSRGNYTVQVSVTPRIGPTCG